MSIIDHVEIVGIACLFFFLLYKCIKWAVLDALNEWEFEMDFTKPIDEVHGDELNK